MSRILPIACSADKESLFAAIQAEFNAAGYRDYDGTDLALRCSYFNDDVLMRELIYEFQLVVPASAVSSFNLREMRDERQESPVVDFSRFAASPVVIVMSSRTYDALGGDVAAQAARRPRFSRSMDHGSRPGQLSAGIGWQSLVGRDVPLRLMHAHGTTADGLAVLAAEWMWACGGREPSADDARGQAGNLVGALEDLVVEYAPDDDTALRRYRSAGADVVLAQERAVLASLGDQSANESVIVYPAEGTVWIDQVLGRVRRGDAERPDDHAHNVLSEHLRSAQTSERLLINGLHPAGRALGTRQDSERLLAAHPAARRGAVRIINPGAPPMVLPGYRGVRTIAEAWASVAKTADVCLVLDTSVSMEGDKLAAAREAVRRFCRRPQSTATTVGLITFQNTAIVAVPVQPFAAATPAIDLALGTVTAGGSTALIDAVGVAVAELERVAGPGHLRAVLLLTDGHENRSRMKLPDAQAALARAGATVFSIAYGADADLPTLRLLAGTSGLTVTASVRDIEEIYEALSAHI
jgi:Mg-chelatase subunit ChlD